jgi:hypothetical protein
MPSKASDFFAFFFFFVCFNFLAAHYAHMKSPTQERSIASQTTMVKPWYDASWKY